MNCVDVDFTIIQSPIPINILFDRKRRGDSVTADIGLQDNKSARFRYPSSAGSNCRDLSCQRCGVPRGSLFKFPGSPPAVG